MTNYTNVHDFKEDHKSHHHRVKGYTADMVDENGRKKHKKYKKETKKRKKRKQETKKRKKHKKIECGNCASRGGSLEP